jgi:hypothetical protein
VTSDHDIFQNGHAAEKPDILEGACHTQFGDRVDFQAIEPFRFAVRGVQDNLARCWLIDACQAIE